MEEKIMPSAASCRSNLENNLRGHIIKLIEEAVEHCENCIMVDHLSWGNSKDALVLELQEKGFIVECGEYTTIRW